MSTLVSFARPLAALSAALSLMGQTPHVAQLGIQFPPLGRLKYYTTSAILDIRDNLHAAYVRVGWLPNWAKYDKTPWAREDRGMRRLCESGLKVMVLTPSFRDDAQGEDHLYGNIDEFFTRYQQREPGCIVYAELANEADLPRNRFANVEEYARYYGRVAPIVARHGVKVITSGTSGKDLPWTYALASRLAGASPRPPLDGFGFHPYGVPPHEMAAAVTAMQQVTRLFPSIGRPNDVYVTELGEKNAADLYAAIVDLAYRTPALTIFEYERQPGDDPGYGLKDDPALYDAVQRAWKRVVSP
jgi:hypothetical protein